MSNISEEGQRIQCKKGALASKQRESVPKLLQLCSLQSVSIMWQSTGRINNNEESKLQAKENLHKKFNI